MVRLRHAILFYCNRMVVSAGGVEVTGHHKHFYDISEIKNFLCKEVQYYGSRRSPGREWARRPARDEGSRGWGSWSASSECKVMGAGLPEHS